MSDKDIQLERSWKQALAGEFQEEYFRSLRDFVRTEYRRGPVYPPGSRIFRAFDECPEDRTRVVILGQDPYHGPGQANGLCFSVSPGVPIPPSLKNIYKEIRADLGRPSPTEGAGDLGYWARQGVLLLNAILTVRAHEAASHRSKGWERFTDAVIRHLNRERQGLVFLLWGRYAQEKGKMLDQGRHLVLEAAHPSPLSVRGFLGCRHFSRCNEYLRSQGHAEIDW